MRLSMFMISAALTVLPAVSQAADFVPDTPGSTTLDILGDIVPGDAQRLAAAVKDAAGKGIFYRALAMWSDGGRLDEAGTIATAIEVGHLDTTTLAGHDCSSACVVMLAAGRHVAIAAGSRVGVHQARSKVTGEVLWPDTYRMAGYLSGRGVAHAAVVKLLDKTGGDVTFMSDDDMRASGWSVHGALSQVADHAYAASRYNTMPGTNTFDLTEMSQLLNKPAPARQPAWHALIGQPFGMGGHGEDGKGLTGEITAAKLVSVTPSGTLFKLAGTASWAFCSPSQPTVATAGGQGFYALRLNLGPSRNIASAEAWAYATYLAGCHGGVAWGDEEAIARLRYGDTPTGTLHVDAPMDMVPEADRSRASIVPDTQTASAEVVEVPDPTVIPAPAQAAPQAPAVFRPLPAPADEVMTDAPARCRITDGALPSRETDCMVGTAADGSRRLTMAGETGSFWLYPNGPASYLPSLNGRAFALDKPLTLSADRMCLSVPGWEGCAWTTRQWTSLDGINRLVAGLFGAAIETEQRLGLLGN